MQRLRKEQINTISEGLIEVAQTAKALISMNGFDWEPANQIGRHFWMNCFHRYAEKNEQPPLPYVSVVPWGDITDRHQISQKANVVDYAPNTLDGMLPSLSRYQRLFLMVDDGLRFCHADSKCDSFRVAFEKAIEQLAKGKDNNVRSSVAVLIGGDLTCLLAVERRLSADIPVVICTGTGGLADVLAYVKRSGLDSETGQVPLN
ncbi:unnamed protein product [Dibothriocephalus latus]|uniref:TRPM SLOG domain-containing protein n=1 Tax=Dibothriocephalus latus TaxID=60516 RepID=A0A3P6V7V1_DIBLA|nr:unnamed protein product [Dibothriocephalus latus]